MDKLIAGISDGLQKFNDLDLDSVMSELRDVLVNVKQQVAAIDIKEINDNITTITRDVRGITSDEKLGEAVKNLNQALVEIDGLAAKANAGFDPLLADLNAVVAKTEAGIVRIEAAANEISKVSNPRAPAMLQLQDVLSETQRATRSLQELSADLKRNPSVLLRGKAIPK